jgi:gluconolactonase
MSHEAGGWSASWPRSRGRGCGVERSGPQEDCSPTPLGYLSRADPRGQPCYPIGIPPTMSIHGRFSLLATAVLSLLVVPPRGRSRRDSRPRGPPSAGSSGSTLDSIRLVPPTRPWRSCRGVQLVRGAGLVPGRGHLLFSDVPENTVIAGSRAPGSPSSSSRAATPANVPRGGEPARTGSSSTARAAGPLPARRPAGRPPRSRRRRMFVSWPTATRASGFQQPQRRRLSLQRRPLLHRPPLRLLGKNDDPAKELPYNGVYRLQPNGAVSLLTDQMTYPNGIAFSPDESTLYVANSDPEKALWMAYDLEEDARSAPAASSTTPPACVPAARDSRWPEGRRQGNLFATGPGGVLSFAPRRHPPRHPQHRRCHRQLRLGRRRRLDPLHHRRHDPSPASASPQKVPVGMVIALAGLVAARPKHPDQRLRT